MQSVHVRIVHVTIGGCAVIDDDVADIDPLCVGDPSTESPDAPESHVFDREIVDAEELEAADERPVSFLVIEMTWPPGPRLESRLLVAIAVQEASSQGNAFIDDRGTRAVRVANDRAP